MSEQQGEAVTVSSGDVAPIESVIGDTATTTDQVWTSHDIQAGVADTEKPTAVQMESGETPEAFAERLRAMADELARPAGTKGPDPEHWGDASRRERGAHKDDAPPVPEGPAALIDAATGDVLHEDATSDEAAAINAERNQEA